MTSQKLQKAVIRQLGGADVLKDIARYGIDSGFTGFTYYDETIDFFKKNRREIIALVKEMAEDMGVSSFDFVANFLCLKGYKDIEDSILRLLGGAAIKDGGDNITANALAWFAAESVANDLQQ